ncbi:NADPH:quinone oxidoreductase family protein [Novosphingobium sp.]|uniref:NADPH:quinone oxidoreductase family protein n=1 Tax=Novosphingobium sp. TaxID=1874826 RepID=UPI0038BB43F7
MTLAVQATHLGPPDNYNLVDRALPPLSADEVRISVRSVGISYADILIASGQYQAVPPVPYIPGTECSGIVEAVGSAVTDLQPGTLVIARAFGGLMAEEANVSRRAVQALPPGIAFDTAAVLALSYSTAWYALRQRGQIEPGETLLVLGAAGATGYAALQIGKHMGARVIASASSSEKRALAMHAGADAVIDSRSPTWRDDVRAVCPDGAPDVVFDPIGGEATERAFRTLGWGGRQLVIGFTGGIPALRTNLALLKGSSLVGVDVRQFEQREPEAYARNLRQIAELAESGTLQPAISRHYGLNDFRDAMHSAANGETAGRVVINI